MTFLNHSRRTRAAHSGQTFFAWGGGLLLALFLLAPGAPEAVDCELAFEPGAVAAGAEAVQVQATPTEEMEGVDRVHVVEESGLVISLVPDEENVMLVNATAATPGEWYVTFAAGDEPVCGGILHVTPETR